MLAGGAGLALWLVKARTVSPDPLAVAGIPAETAVAEPPDPTPPPLAPEQVQQAVAEAPLLSPAAARAWLTEAARRGQVPGHALDGALAVASEGFADLDRATLDELGALFTKGMSMRSAADQGRIQAYMGYVRSGEPLPPEAVALGRSLFVESLRSLPASSQSRLTALFEKAVTTGIAHRQQAEERGRLAALTPLPAAEATPPAPAVDTSLQARRHASRWPAPSASPGPVAAALGAASSSAEGYAGDRGRESSTGGSESYWRSRAASARRAVAAAEKRVHDLEEQAARGGPLVPGPLPAACQAGEVTSYRGLPASSGSGGVSLRDRSRTAVHCDSEILRQQAARNTQGQLEAARQSLTNAQRALDALEEEARRAGVLPGWLR